MKVKLKWYLIGLTLLIVSQLFFAVYFNFLGIGGTKASTEKTTDILSNPALLIIPIIIAPLLEEFIFRFLLYRKNMMEPYSTITAVLSSIFFGVVHGQNVTITVPLVLNGLIYCLVYKKSDSIWISVLTHASYNLLIFIIIYFTLGGR